MPVPRPRSWPLRPAISSISAGRSRRTGGNRIAKDTALVAELEGFIAGQSGKVKRAQAELDEAELEAEAAEEESKQVGEAEAPAGAVGAKKVPSIVVDAAARAAGISSECCELVMEELLKTSAAFAAAVAAPAAAADEEKVGSAGNARPPVDAPAASRARVAWPNGGGVEGTA